RPAETRRSDHGDVGGRQLGSGGKRITRNARSRAQAEPPHGVRHGQPFLSRLSACATGRRMRARGLIQAVAETGACARAWGDPMAQPSWPQVDHQPASGSDAEWPLMADIVAKKSFCTGDQKFSRPYTRFSCKGVGDLIA